MSLAWEPGMESESPTMAEAGFRLAVVDRACDDGRKHLYSRCDCDEQTYYHGVFTHDLEMLTSIAERCAALGVRFVPSYARRLLREYTF